MAWTDLGAALALILVLEGLLLLTMPGTWRELIRQMLESSDAALRRIGGIMVVLGLLALFLVRG